MLRAKTFSKDKVEPLRRSATPFAQMERIKQIPNPDINFSYALSDNKQSKWKIFTEEKRAKVELESIKNTKTINARRDPDRLNATSNRTWNWTG